MSNPFLDRSLTEWRDGIPGYTDSELNALCACVCGGEWVKHTHRDMLGWYIFRKSEGWWWPVLGVPADIWAYRPTTDEREAMRLLEGYSYSITKDEACEVVMVVLGWLDRPTDSIHKWNRSCAGTGTLCRAITGAVVTSRLTQWIEGVS